MAFNPNTLSCSVLLIQLAEPLLKAKGNEELKKEIQVWLADKSFHTGIRMIFFFIDKLQVEESRAYKSNNFSLYFHCSLGVQLMMSAMNSVQSVSLLKWVIAFFFFSNCKTRIKGVSVIFATVYFILSFTLIKSLMIFRCFEVEKMPCQ